ncbi:subtilisin-like protease SBT1.5 [Diospyros lotus]|uniref:subtilisin-like protease SBT1.5 n=1 Tax=Diospyros lotus TaxID=55363 RepID=UPI002253414F|nr:subtilisin-like protease SBT1.5 [Diospyros lotus]
MAQFWCLALATSLLVLPVISGAYSETRQTFIVRVQTDLKPLVFSNVEKWYSSTLGSLSSLPIDSQRGKESNFIHVYKTVFSGFSARLTRKQAQELAGRPEVLGVLPDRVRHVQTTRSPEFLGLGQHNPGGLLIDSDSGSNVIIGVLDTGIFPERPSFHDEGLGPVPSHWKGECTEGEKFTKANCNKKIIGARYFINGYKASMGPMNTTTDIKSARDIEGHGTHTASTAAGRKVANASLFGLASGVAMGIASKARIAAYKICWKKGCLDSDILAGFDKAVEDGVNVISLSVGAGSGLPYDEDPIAIASFAATERGIFVSASAGNNGAEMSVTNVAPWITTVGASTIDRKFAANLLLEDGTIITGSSLFTDKPLPKKTYFPLVYAANASKDNNIIDFPSPASTCRPGSLDENLIRGKIVVCDRGGVPRVLKGAAVKAAGGVGVIVENLAANGEGLIADAHILPGLAVTASAGNKVRAYISSSKNPRATMVFGGTRVGVKPAPIVASFSSRGPSSESLYVLKPDVIAPGVNILAAWPDTVSPSTLPSDRRRTEFNIISGTSMSCPHVSGVAALLKGAHLDWSPAMIRSALMTTAYTIDSVGRPLLDETNNEIADVWATGAGHVAPQKAVDPGLVYDLTADDYLDFLCASGYSVGEIKHIADKSVSCKEKKQYRPWELNYPAISVVFENSSQVAMTRTVTHVVDSAATYSVRVSPPRDVKVKVEPSKLDFKEKGEKKTYTVRISSGNKPPPGGRSLQLESGKLTWTDGKHRVSSPITVVWLAPM